MNIKEIRELMKNTHEEITESEWNHCTGDGVCEFELDEELSMYFKPKEKIVMEYLDAYGKWHSDDYIYTNINEYNKNMKELSYNFTGDYKYFMSETSIGDKVIWRKKK